MQEEGTSSLAVERFIREQIDSVPHLEALLLLWKSRPKRWSVEEMGKGLYLDSAAAKQILDDLVRAGLIASPRGEYEIYQYEPEPDRDRIVSLVDSTYRRELVRVSRLIHSKAPAAVRAFAQAFRLKKVNE